MPDAYRALLQKIHDDPAAARAALVAEQARRSGSRNFAAFVKQAWGLIPGAGALQWNAYLEGLCAVLEALARRRIRRLVGNGPPRNGKSNAFAILWPAWVWTWNPREEFVFLSFSQALVQEHSVKCRDVIQSRWYRETFRPTWELRSDRNRQDDFENTVGGRRIAATMKGAGMTGRGGNVIAIDDPLSAEEAGSAAERAEAVRILEQVVNSRFNDPANGVAAMLMQRVHWEDPSAWALRVGWTHMLAPLEKDDRECAVLDDAGAEVWRDRREPGEVLVPERFPPKRVAEIKANLVMYAAQYQQSPVQHVNAGAYFQRAWFKMLRAAPVSVARRVRSWDLASTEGGGDWTVGVRLAQLENGRLVVEDVVRGQWGPHMVRETVKNTAELDGYDCEIVIPQDPGQAGKDQAQEYAVRLVGYTVHSPRPTGDKEVRAGAASSQVRAENVDMVVAPWNEPFLQTLEAFPDPSVHDDDVDALSGAVTHLAQKQKTQAELWEEMDLG